MGRLSIYYGRIYGVRDEPPGQTGMLDRQPIRDAVEASKEVERYGHTWVLGNLHRDDEGSIITGRLGYPETETRTQQDYDAETHEFVDRAYELPDARSAAFA